MFFSTTNSDTCIHLRKYVEYFRVIQLLKLYQQASVTMYILFICKFVYINKLLEYVSNFRPQTYLCIIRLSVNLPTS